MDTNVHMVYLLGTIMFLIWLFINNKYSGGDLDRYEHAMNELRGIHPGDPYYTKVAEESKPNLRYYIIKYLLYIAIIATILGDMYYIVSIAH